MKRTILVSVMALGCVIGLQAQQCNYAKKHCDKTAMTAHCLSMKASLAAADDVNIISVSNDLSTNYMRKKVCCYSGTVSYEPVKYDFLTGTFVNYKDCDISKCDISKCKDLTKCLEQIKKCAAKSTSVVGKTETAASASQKGA